MGKRRDAEGGAIAGKDAPADLFRLVSNGTNEMMDYRAGKRPPDGAVQTAARGEAEVAKPAPKPPQRRVARLEVARPGEAPPSRPFAGQRYQRDFWDEEDFWAPEDEEPLGSW
jgi:hypothetical protein